MFSSLFILVRFTDVPLDENNSRQQYRPDGGQYRCIRCAVESPVSGSAPGRINKRVDVVDGPVRSHPVEYLGLASFRLRAGAAQGEPRTRGLPDRKSVV